MTESSAPISGYDAAQDSQSRTSLIFPKNSRVEYSRATRRKLLEKMRALEANFTLIGRIKSKYGRCVAGRGIFPQPATSVGWWNDLAKEFFERWASNPRLYSVDASRDFWSDQKLAAEEVGAGDGEFFEQLVKVDDGAGNILPMVQPLDPFEIESPDRFQSARSLVQFEDGVRTNQFLRPISYAVRELPAPGAASPVGYREVSAADIVHLFRRRRAKHLRGLPPLYSGLNDGHDAMDTLAFEKATAKLHALLGITKTVKPENRGTGVAGQIKRALAADGAQTLEERFPAAAATIELNEGETLDFLTSSRPSIAVLDGIKFYCHLLSLGADLPFSVVFSFAGVGGTATRADLEDAQSTFEMGQDTIVWTHSQRIYTWRLAIAQETGELPRCPDPYWWRCDWHGPAKITVDYGRSADANIKLTRNALLSHPRYFEERGQDAKTEMRRQIDFLKWLKTECAADEIPIEWLIEPTPGAVVPGNAPEPAPAPGE